MPFVSQNSTELCFPSFFTSSLLQQALRSVSKWTGATAWSGLRGDRWHPAESTCWGCRRWMHGAVKVHRPLWPSSPDTDPHSLPTPPTAWTCLRTLQLANRESPQQSASPFISSWADVLDFRSIAGGAVVLPEAHSSLMCCWSGSGWPWSCWFTFSEVFKFNHLLQFRNC